MHVCARVHACCFVALAVTFVVNVVFLFVCFAVFLQSTRDVPVFSSGVMGAEVRTKMTIGGGATLALPLWKSTPACKSRLFSSGIDLSY